MKIRRLMVLFMLFVFALSSAAYADIAYEPNDDFYAKYRDECKYEDRVYITNGQDGYVIGCTSPTGDASVVLPNGNEYYVSYTWADDGRLWGCVEYDPTSLESAWQNTDSAWVDMSAMTPRYDSEAFRQDHAKEIQSGDFVLEVNGVDEVIAYRYPGSGIVVEHIGFFGNEEPFTMSFNMAYADAEGREWGHGTYHYGLRDFWVCISEPYTELAAGAEFTEREIIPGADEAAMKKALNESSGLSVNILVGAVGTLVIAGAIVAYIIIRKRRAE